MDVGTQREQERKRDGTAFILWEFTHGVLPFALRVALCAFKIVPDNFVIPLRRASFFARPKKRDAKKGTRQLARPKTPGSCASRHRRRSGNSRLKSAAQTTLT